jgi:hypothetical protein
MKGQRNTHFWTYVGVSNGKENGEFKGELAYCDLCKKYAVITKSGYTFITKKLYTELLVPESQNW